MEFQRQHPRVAFTLMVADRSVDLTAERIDLAVRITNSLEPTLITRAASAASEEEGEERLRSGSGAAAAAREPGRRRVRAVSSKSSPDAADDSVELRSVSTDIAGAAV